MGKPINSNENLKKALKLIKSGHSISYASKSFKISRETLKHNMKKNNINIVRSRKKIVQNYTKILDLIKNKKSIKKISKIIGVPRTTLQKYIKLHNCMMYVIISELIIICCIYII